MRVSHLSLTSWRNYEQADLSFPAGPTVLLGANGQGKTNAVEALVFLSTLKSHRLAQGSGLIRSGSTSAVIRARLLSAEREVRLECQLNVDRPNVAQINGNPAKMRELTRYCHVVLFAPEDLTIVRGDPSERRNFVDDLLAQLNPRMAGVIADYERVVRQRSNLLKTARNASSLSTLEVWDDKLVELGSELLDARTALVNRLGPPLERQYEALVDADHQPRLEWMHSIGDSEGMSTSEKFRRALSEVRDQERERGVTLVGPHRDDLLFQLNTLPVKGYASHGETWSFTLALKLAAADVLRADSSVGDPIIVLDDVFAELDVHRRERLTQAVASYEQVIVTAAVVDDVPTEFAQHVHHISAGRIQESGVSDE
ncbi:MAG TPA: DNA replication/repair protein RecF [Microbacteriaceae bacterium]|nr:DNA replication/repair protein RecF [Microbacteriaceae bacterium]